VKVAHMCEYVHIGMTTNMIVICKCYGPWYASCHMWSHAINLK